MFTPLLHWNSKGKTVILWVTNVYSKIFLCVSHVESDVRAISEMKWWKNMCVCHSFLTWANSTGTSMSCSTSMYKGIGSSGFLLRVLSDFALLSCWNTVKYFYLLLTNSLVQWFAESLQHRKSEATQRLRFGGWFVLSTWPYRVKRAAQMLTRLI